MNETKTKSTKKTNLKIGFLLVMILLFLVSFSTFSPLMNDRVYHRTNSSTDRFWKYQCFDTMKTSRDKARAWKDDKQLLNKINREMDAIVDLGGNCVAIATPYDKEFLPYLRKWVKSARDRKLHIWYRGNFSSWEGWFEYPKGMSAQEHHTKTKQFIADNDDLFEDGDIFTPSPEGENGGPFNQVEKDEHEVFRKFLIEEYNGAKESFAKINKKVEVDWLSMNGGLARRMFDQPTIDNVGKTVAIDHYIKTAPEMGEYISYFKNNFNAKLVIGEFGAPIPDINGDMNEEEQAKFVAQLFDQLVLYNDSITGINYWTVWDGSAALYNPDWSERKVVNVVKKYMKPGLLTGQVLSTLNEPIKDVVIKTKDNLYQTKSDQDGFFDLLIPEGNYQIEITHPEYTGQNENISMAMSEKKQKAVVLIPKDQDLWYRTKTTIFNIRREVTD